MLNWATVREETTRILQDLIRINTTNPPGNEIEIAIYLQDLLARHQIGATIYEKAPGRASLVARLKGSGEKRPLVLLAHTDVVAAQAAKWEHPPFAGHVAEEMVWGRGALDMKGMLALELMALILFKQSGQTAQRDLILVAAADEEAGGQYGMEWLFKEEIPGLKEAEYVINESGEGQIINGVPVYSCQAGEKGILWLKLLVKGTSGHASLPLGDNVIYQMGLILNKLRQLQQEPSLSATGKAFLEGMASFQGYPLPEKWEKESFLELLGLVNKGATHAKRLEAMFYNTISPTVIKAGEKLNVLPDICELSLDCRLVPGLLPEDFLGYLRENLRDFPVEMEIIEQSQATESRINSQLFQVIEEVVKREDQRGLVLPTLASGATDSRFFRQQGITAYGFMPFLVSEAEISTMHGINERIAIDNLERGARMLYRIVEKIIVSELT